MEVGRGEGVSSRCQCGQSRAGQGNSQWLEAGNGGRGSQPGAGLQNRLLGTGKRPGKNSWKALPEVLQEEAEGVAALAAVVIVLLLMPPSGTGSVTWVSSLAARTADGLGFAGSSARPPAVKCSR